MRGFPRDAPRPVTDDSEPPFLLRNHAGSILLLLARSSFSLHVIGVNYTINNQYIKQLPGDNPERTEREIAT